MRLIFFSLYRPLSLVFFVSPLFFLVASPLVDAGSTAHQILSLLEGSPTEGEKELLKSVAELLHSEPKGAPTPSLSVEGDYLRIPRLVCARPCFRIAGARSRHGILGFALGFSRGVGSPRKSKIVWPWILVFIAPVFPGFSPVRAM